MPLGALTAQRAIFDVGERHEPAIVYQRLLELAAVDGLTSAIVESFIGEIAKRATR